MSDLSIETVLTLDEQIDFLEIPSRRVVFTEQLRSIAIRYKNNEISKEEKEQLLDEISESEEFTSIEEEHLQGMKVQILNIIDSLKTY